MRLVVVVAAVAAVSLAGCGKKAEESAKRSASVEPDGAAAVATAMAVAEARRPDFAPLHPGAQTQGAVANLRTGGGTLVYTVAATPQAVVDFYKDKTAASGFETAMDSNMGAARMFAAKNEASGEELQVIVSAADGGGSSVQLIWATRKK